MVTGASSGIGEAFCRNLAKRGSNLILVARSADKLEHLAETLSCQHNVDLSCIPIDLAKVNSSQDLFDQVQDAGLSVDVLINNAGFGYSGKFLDNPMNNYDEMINLNIGSLTHLTHLFLKDMVSNNKGGIINISSLASFQPIPYFSIYAATKAFVTSFTLSLYEEYREKNICILGVCPGYTKTNFNKRAHMSSKPVAGYLMSSQEVVDESLRAYQRGKFLIINGRINRFVKLFTSLIPRSWSLKMASSIIKKGMDNQQW